MTSDLKPVIHKCFDECGAEFTLVDPLSYPPGWVWLPIARAWRCISCVRRLDQVNRRPTPKDES